jgi:hypothetical protein
VTLYDNIRYRDAAPEREAEDLWQDFGRQLKGGFKRRASECSLPDSSSAMRDVRELLNRQQRRHSAEVTAAAAAAAAAHRAGAVAAAASAAAAAAASSRSRSGGARSTSPLSGGRARSSAPTAGSSGSGSSGGAGNAALLAPEPILLSLADVTAAGLHKLLQAGGDTNMYFDPDSQRWLGESDEVDLSGFDFSAGASEDGDSSQSPTAAAPAATTAATASGTAATTAAAAASRLAGLSSTSTAASTTGVAADTSSSSSLAATAGVPAADSFSSAVESSVCDDVEEDDWDAHLGLGDAVSTGALKLNFSNVLEQVCASLSHDYCSHTACT